MLDQLEESVRKFVVDICAVMYQYGFSEVSVGAILRLMGIDEENAAPFDRELMLLDESILEHKISRQTDLSKELPPAGTTLH